MNTNIFNDNVNTDICLDDDITEKTIFNREFIEETNIFNKNEIKALSFKIEKYSIINKTNVEIKNNGKNLTSNLLCENKIFDFPSKSNHIKNKENLNLNSFYKPIKENQIENKIIQENYLFEKEVNKHANNGISQDFISNKNKNSELGNTNYNDINLDNMSNFSNFKTSKFHVVKEKDNKLLNSNLFDKTKDQTSKTEEVNVFEKSKNSINHKNVSIENIKEKNLVEDIHNKDLFLYLKKFPDKKNDYLLNLIKTYNINFSNNIIDLSHKNIGSSELELISNFLKSDSDKFHCSEFKICNQNLNQKTIQNISCFCSLNTCLKFLDLSGCQIGDLGCRHFCEAFHNNKNIEEINLQKNNIGDFGAEILSDLITTNENISKLELEHNFIGNKGAEKLYDAIRKNLKIKWLNLFGNISINNSIITKISSQLKNNRINNRTKKINTLNKKI